MDRVGLEGNQDARPKGRADLGSDNFQGTALQAKHGVDQTVWATLEGGPEAEQKGKISWKSDNKDQTSPVAGQVAQESLTAAAPQEQGLGTAAAQDQWVAEALGL